MFATRLFREKIDYRTPDVAAWKTGFVYWVARAESSALVSVEVSLLEVLVPPWWNTLRKKCLVAEVILFLLYFYDNCPSLRCVVEGLVASSVWRGDREVLAAGGGPALLHRKYIRWKRMVFVMEKLNKHAQKNRDTSKEINPNIVMLFYLIFLLPGSYKSAIELHEIIFDLRFTQES